MTDCLKLPKIMTWKEQPVKGSCKQCKYRAQWWTFWLSSWIWPFWRQIHSLLSKFMLLFFPAVSGKVQVIHSTCSVSIHCVTLLECLKLLFVCCFLEIPTRHLKHTGNIQNWRFACITAYSNLRIESAVQQTLSSRLLTWVQEALQKNLNASLESTYTWHLSCNKTSEIHKGEFFYWFYVAQWSNIGSSGLSPLSEACDQHQLFSHAISLQFMNVWHFQIQTTH